MNTPLVSIVTPTHNRADLLREAIQSSLAQTHQNFEMLIVDNGSTDNTKETVVSFHDPRIRYFYQDDSGSPVSPRNKGFRNAKGEIVCFLDSDDLWLPEKLSLQVEQFLAHPEFGMIYADCYLMDEQGNTKGLYSDFHEPRQGSILQDLLRDNFIPAVTVAVKKEVLAEFGPLNESYLIPHDLDLYLKIASKYEIGFIERPLAKLRLHRSSLSQNRIRNRLEVLQVLKPWCLGDQSHQVGQGFRKRTWAFNCLKAGLEMIGFPEHRAEGRRMLRTALRYEPFNPMNWAGFLLAWLPKTLLRPTMNLARRRWSVESVNL